MDQNCKTCKFYFEQIRDGECRRYPPQLFVMVYTDAQDEVDSSHKTGFPDVDDGDWCGEYKPKKKETNNDDNQTITSRTS